jgi:hypothetical protein
MIARMASAGSSLTLLPPPSSSPSLLPLVVLRSISLAGRLRLRGLGGG